MENVYVICTIEYITVINHKIFNSTLKMFPLKEINMHKYAKIK